MEPIDETGARAALPRRVERAKGLFAWGRTTLPSRQLAVAWAEFLFVFVIVPVAAIIADAIQFIPLAVLMMLCSTGALLSMTRSFHWDDLAPTDMLSEWRLYLICLASLMGTCFLLTLFFFPEFLFSAPAGAYPMLLAFPLVTALPIELVYRALFFRRFGHLFYTEVNAVAVGALSNGLVYYMLSHSGAAALFGVVVGSLLGYVYLRSGQFVLCILIHWTAALCIWLIGPGFTVF